MQGISLSDSYLKTSNSLIFYYSYCPQLRSVNCFYRVNEWMNEWLLIWASHPVDTGCMLASLIGSSPRRLKGNKGDALPLDGLYCLCGIILLLLFLLLTVRPVTHFWARQRLLLVIAGSRRWSLRKETSLTRVTVWRQPVLDAAYI